MPRSIAIVGAGMAGLACATQLARDGRRVTLFDKGRGPGGRMATRRAEIGGETVRFDHGAQYFTARDTGFQEQVALWERESVVARWPAAGEDAWVGTPAMNAPIKALAEPLEVQWAARVTDIVKSEQGWRLNVDDEIHEFESVVFGIPAEQAAELLADIHAEFADRARRTQSRPCWALMAQFPERLECGDVLRGGEGDTVSWAARNGAKPGHDGSESWVVHGSPDWSLAHLEEEAENVAGQLLDAFLHQAEVMPQAPLHMAAHRWRFAMAEPIDGPDALWDAEARIGVAGDWLIAPRVEAAWLSGTRLARAILR
ncbi:FAD-dependent oxidoreductase [Qipengyuania sp. XHP0211]|uniref:NAD(P)/FAD-dependent oxidoreductase n=1 Tax=Qipengyuania sp. XHP0211 TaxID=3038079 RepID=UPI00241FE87C|nr:FAD-dependent oxidoreductase [Qipengyuania sp. XHP0211]MDG5750790.1 FAD-dependent oxidoreductase [Qipengyuania sp. XHP0211]